MGRNYDVITFISTYFTLRRPKVAIFADIIKIITMFTIIIFKDSTNVKRIRNYVPKYNLYLHFFI